MHLAAEVAGRGLSKGVLLDTSAYSELRRGHEGVARRVRRAACVVFSPIVAGELLHGFRRGTRFEKNEEELWEFLESPLVHLLAVTLTTADRFSRIMSALRERGTPIPTNDIWVAAQALESGAELLSFDRHFEQVPGLAWVLPEGKTPG